MGQGYTHPTDPNWIQRTINTLFKQRFKKNSWSLTWHRPWQKWWHREDQPFPNLEGSATFYGSSCMLNSRWCNQLLQSLHSKPNPSSHWASRTSNLMFPQALSRSDCCLNIRVGEGKSDLGDKGGNPGGLWWVFMEWYVYIMHINIIYHVWYTSPCMYPLPLSLFPFIFQIFPKCFSLKSPSVPSKVCWCWVLPAHDFKVLLDEATNLLDTKVAPQSATGNPRETPVTRAHLFEGFFYLTTRIP